jgi:hypothetical protein
MIPRRIFSLLILTSAILFLTTLSFSDRPASFAAQPAANSGDDKDQNIAGQLKELQKQVAELQTQVNDLMKFRIIAAGTATLKLGPRQDNKNSIRVKLPVEIVTQLGNSCIVQLTNRYPPTPDFFVPYWRPANDGVDIVLADPSLDGDYRVTVNRNAPYVIDWTVIQK